MPGRKRRSRPKRASHADDTLHLKTRSLSGAIDDIFVSPHGEPRNEKSKSYPRRKRSFSEITMDDIFELPNDTHSGGRSKNHPRRNRSLSEDFDSILVNTTIQTNLNQNRSQHNPGAQPVNSKQAEKPRRKKKRKSRVGRQTQNTSSFNLEDNDVFVDPIPPNEESNCRSNRNRGTKRSQKHGDLKSGDKHHLRENTSKQKQSLKNEDINVSKTEANILLWDSPADYVPVRHEEYMVDFMFKRNGKNERGMMKGKPPFVLSKYRKAMRKLEPGGMTLPQILSLRRHHIKLLNPHKNMAQLGLGDTNEINESARLFEVATGEFLKKSSIRFMTETDQRREAEKEGEILTATPDFLFYGPVLLQKVRKPGENSTRIKVVEERKVHWIEVKMFYGASTIPSGKKNGAVGSVLSQARKYVNRFGEGAFLFMMGCGKQLATELNEIGVTVVDCSGDTVSLNRVHQHQRTWCANEKGNILP